MVHPNRSPRSLGHLPGNTLRLCYNGRQPQPVLSLSKDGGGHAGDGGEGTAVVYGAVSGAVVGPLILPFRGSRRRPACGSAGPSEGWSRGGRGCSGHRVMMGFNSARPIKWFTRRREEGSAYVSPPLREGQGVGAHPASGGSLRQEERRFSRRDRGGKRDAEGLCFSPTT